MCRRWARAPPVTHQEQCSKRSFCADPMWTPRGRLTGMSHWTRPDTPDGSPVPTPAHLPVASLSSSGNGHQGRTRLQAKCLLLLSLLSLLPPPAPSTSLVCLLLSPSLCSHPTLQHILLAQHLQHHPTLLCLTAPPSSRSVRVPPSPAQMTPVSFSLHFLFPLWCCCSVAQACLTLCDPMDCSTPGFPVLHHLPCSNLFKFRTTESVMPSNHLGLCHPLLLLPSASPSIRVFPNEKKREAPSQPQ